MLLIEIYRITSNNSRRNYQLFTIFSAGIIRGQELLEYQKFISCSSQLQLPVTLSLHKKMHN